MARLCCLRSLRRPTAGCPGGCFKTGYFELALRDFTMLAARRCGVPHRTVLIARLAGETTSVPFKLRVPAYRRLSDRLGEPVRMLCFPSNTHVLCLRCWTCVYTRVCVCHRAKCTSPQEL